MMQKYKTRKNAIGNTAKTMPSIEKSFFSSFTAPTILVISAIGGAAIARIPNRAPVESPQPGGKTNIHAKHASGTREI